MSNTRRVRYGQTSPALEHRTETFTLPDGTELAKGDQVKVAGEAGEYRFCYAWKGQPVFYGGEPSHKQYRSFRLEKLGRHVPKRKRNLSDEQREALRERMAQVRAARKAVAA